jgi:hypothetical protein
MRGRTAVAIAGGLLVTPATAHPWKNDAATAAVAEVLIATTELTTRTGTAMHSRAPRSHSERAPAAGVIGRIGVSAGHESLPHRYRGFVGFTTVLKAQQLEMKKPDRRWATGQIAER